MSCDKCKAVLDSLPVGHAELSGEAHRDNYQGRVIDDLMKMVEEVAGE